MIIKVEDTTLFKHGRIDITFATANLETLSLALISPECRLSSLREIAIKRALHIMYRKCTRILLLTLW